MCLAIPGKLIERTGDLARVDFGGVTRVVALDLLPEAGPGDYLLVHAGYAIQRIDESEALATLELLETALRSG